MRLTGELYAQLLKTQLLLCNTSDSSKPSRELDDVLHTLNCLKAEGEKWALLLDAGDKLALCAMLNKHMQHALLLQTVQPWLSVKVCVHIHPHQAFCSLLNYQQSVHCKLHLEHSN